MFGRTMLATRSGRATARTTLDDADAIWRGEIPDDQIVFDRGSNLADGESASAARSLRRALIDLFGEPIGGVAIDAPVVHHRDRLASGSRRGGGSIDQHRTAGCQEEIQVVLLAHPVDAAAAITERRLLDSVGRVTVDATGVRSARQQLSWPAAVRTGFVTRRRATLRLYGSPSGNITVLTLTPERSRRRGVRRFVRWGLDGVSMLCLQIERELAASPARADVRDAEDMGVASMLTATTPG